jgi:hypothetical protein
MISLIHAQKNHLKEERMPGKSGHKRGKRLYQSHKSKTIARQSDGIVQQGVSEAKSTPVAKPAPVEVKSSKLAAAAAMPAATLYPFVRSELARIGILFGIVLMVLIVLSIVLK